MPVQATIGIARAILAESTLSFLGLGVLAPVPTWGAMLNDARGHLFDAPHMVVFPAGICTHCHREGTVPRIVRAHVVRVLLQELFGNPK